MLNFNPSTKHYYSPEIGVSIELPTNWQECDRYSQGVMYGCQNCDRYPPKLLVQIVPLPPSISREAGSPNRCDTLAKKLLKLQPPSRPIRDRQYLEIDSCRARIDTFTFDDPEFHVSVTHYQVCIQRDNLLYGVIGMVETRSASTYLPIFAAATQSIRFI